MKKVLVFSCLLFSFSAQADIFLDLGESIRIGGNNIYCGGQPVKTYFCTINSAFNESFSGEGNTLLQAQNNAFNACAERRHPMHCQKNTLSCDSN